ncbi:MAG TPA: hypothetical protein VK652_01050 [Steroidobacteraceae bacterium]|nr:hypothetical protein [Steroidobacteraceae bacterium]
MTLTDPQRRALAFLATVGESGAAPSRIGGAMMTEKYRRQKRPSPQGLGRVGGVMAWRLIKAGFVRNTQCLTKYAITQAGRDALK